MIVSNEGDTLALMKGNRAAADFVELIVRVLHFWDDLIDRDKPLDDAAINSAMLEALVTLPRNAFYRAHFDTLNTVLMNSITNWHVATKLERSGDEYRERIAYILRSSYVDLITTAAQIVGGPTYAIEVGEGVRLYAHKETWGGYLMNLRNETKAREAKEKR
ncbi:hypothetical protein [Paraburkholderia terrae]|uniref:hypothetical protein n=1 Tax=Paraburkholderia terrae TaxID=311230 RepID=UPI001EE171B0|nr:hypothetical protein [Paraburkholderia terrae]GJH00209.1 hypothetical protein CBA19C8_06650 [Paraburkholderia terrae]